MVHGKRTVFKIKVAPLVLNKDNFHFYKNEGNTQEFSSLSKEVWLLDAALNSLRVRRMGHDVSAEARIVWDFRILFS